MDLRNRFPALRACFLSTLTLFWTLSLVAGCNGEPSTPSETADENVSAAVNGADEGHDHDHDHDHSHMGIHGGHVVVLEPGHVHAEWVHVDEDQILEVYVLDNPEAVKSVKLVSQITGQEPVEYELEPAAESLGKGGYQINSPNLLTSVEMADGETNKVTLVVETEEETLRAGLAEAGDHDHDHGHDH